MSPIASANARRLCLLAPALLLAAACTPGTSRPTNGVTPDNHTYFPITAGAMHELGKAVREGPITCDSCHPPAAASFKDIACLACHKHAQAVTDRLHTSVATYAYQSKNCYSCHPTGERQAFDHCLTAGAGGTCAGLITDGCAMCHNVDNQFAALPLAGFTHQDMGGADCGTCHVTTTWKGANGAPPGKTFNPAKDVIVNALIPTYSSTSISRVTPLVETLHMEMVHSSTQLPGGAMSACTNCHEAGAYFPGLLHSSLANLTLPQPTACSSCHAAAPTGFVGPTATSPARTPASGEMKHDAVSWTAGAPTTTRLVTADCGVCHVPPGNTLAATWLMSPPSGGPARFHASLTAAGLQQPGSCVDCHANSKPTVVLNAGNATLPANLQFDHGTLGSSGDCVTCHSRGGATQWTSFSKGQYHLAGAANPTTCLPCHAGERPTATTGWTSTAYTASPFDYGTNPAGVTHGDGQDCAGCHQGPGTGGAWGGSQTWAGGHFAHGPTTVAGTTCVACHMSQRPDLQPGATAAGMATLLGFDHSLDGTGECFGCHLATITGGSYVHYTNPATGTLPGGDWDGGTGYPGSAFASSASQFVTVTEYTLNRGGANNLVTGTSAINATLYNGMLHISTALPPELSAGPTGMPDRTKCWHCHTATGTVVTEYRNGQYHTALTTFAATPGGAVVPFPQPTGKCADCHQQMLPTNIVERVDAGTLRPMDHAAQFTAAVTIGGVSVTRVSQLDCSVCHRSPGVSWGDGQFHVNIGAAVPQDCVACHYLVMADAPRADVASGTAYAMKHLSTQLTLQTCQTCHASALAQSGTAPTAATLWRTGALHGSVTTQPTACVDCHSISDPTSATQSLWSYVLALGGTATNGGQWNNHASGLVVGKDCSVCHAADAKSSGSAWNRQTQFHAGVTAASTCQECHGLTNGNGAVAGTRNNLPTGLTNSATVSSAASDATTGIAAGTLDQIAHTDFNVSSKDCKVCHSQAGLASTPPVQGKEWAQASFHAAFTGGSTLVMNGTTGRCSNCHFGLKPTATFTQFDHSAITATPGSSDCSACHSYPGTGTPAAPNWLGAAAMPPYISVGGFTIPAPPAATAGTIQPGIANLPHPTVAPTTPCTTCHGSTSGGKHAIGYDHLSTLIATNCAACHEAGSDLVGTPWNGSTTPAGGAGDTRPFTLVGTVATFNGNSYTLTNSYSHFYKADCKECHGLPSGNGLTTTGTTYRSVAWKFVHSTSKMTRPSTCDFCHAPPNNIPN